MQNRVTKALDHPRFFSAAMVFIIVVVILRVITTALKLPHVLDGAGNDDFMRLLSVREFMAGQGWFDTTQYRLMPPDGVVMHWSRYIDAAIAGLILFLSLFLSPETAEFWAAAFWPVLLYIIFVLLLGNTTKRLFGPVAACGALLFALLWPFIFLSYFYPGRLDHHNMQTLMMFIAVIGVLEPRRPLWGGAYGGLAAAFSLAIGLEGLPFVVALGMLVVIRAAFETTPDAGRIAKAFCIALGVGAVVFWFGQTPPTERLIGLCDELSTPTLSLVAICIVAGLVPMFLKGGWLRLGATTVLTIAGIAVAWPVLHPCFGGPYGALPVEVQEIISTRIAEALPAQIVAVRKPLSFNLVATPVILVIIGAAIFCWKDRGSDRPQGARPDILLQLLILSLVGVALSFMQIRLLVMAAPVLPMLAGYVLARLTDNYIVHRSSAFAFLWLGGLVFILTPSIFNDILAPYLAPEMLEDSGEKPDCSSFEAMQPLNDIPPAVILTSTNLGPPMLFATHHSSLSGPYHRSPAAFMNGMIPFDLNDADLQDYVADTNATHILLCHNASYPDDSLSLSLSRDGTASWLTPVPLPDTDLLLFAVNLPK